MSTHREDTLVQSMLTYQGIAVFAEAKVRKFAHEFFRFQEIVDSEQEREKDAGAAKA